MLLKIDMYKYIFSEKKKNRLLESMYSMMVVPSWSTVCNDRIENEVRA